MDENMIERKSWKEFRDAGMIWFLNMFLHIFGWCLVIEADKETKEVTSVYPARTKFRGFDEKTNERGYIRVAEYMMKNAEELLKEAKE